MCVQCLNFKVDSFLCCNFERSLGISQLGTFTCTFTVDVINEYLTAVNVINEIFFAFLVCIPLKRPIDHRHLDIKNDTFNLGR